MWGQDHTDRPGHSPSSRHHFTACVAPSLGGRESWGLLTHGVTAELCDGMSQLLSLSILFCGWRSCEPRG